MSNNEDKNKWELFKQFMHNEMGISKEDIRQWVREAVADEARKLIKQSFGEFSTDAIVKTVVKQALMEDNWFNNKNLHQEIRKEASKILAESLQISVKGE